MRPQCAVGTFTALATTWSCQALLNLDREPGATDAGTTVAEASAGDGPSLAPDATDAASTDQPGDARKLWQVGAATSGIAVATTALFWVNGSSVFSLTKSQSPAAPQEIKISCLNPPLAGPIAYASTTYVACGSGPGGHVMVHSWLSGTTSTKAIDAFPQGGEVFGIGAASPGVGAVFSYGGVGCGIMLKAPPAVDIPCTPGRTAAANEAAFYYVSGVGAIVQSNWDGVPGPAVSDATGVNSISATNSDIFWAGSRGLARVPLANPDAAIVDPRPSTLVATHGSRVAFVRDDRVWLASADLADPKPLSSEGELAEHLAIDGDGVYWKVGDWLWVATFCPGGKLCD